MKLTSKPYQESRAKLLAAVSAHNLVLRRAILRCKHTDIRECDYYHCEYINSDPSRRICMRCGLSEIGWGTGHLILRGEAQHIARDDLLSLRTFSIDEDLKNDLRAGRIGLATALQKALP